MSPTAIARDPIVAMDAPKKPIEDAVLRVLEDRDGHPLRQVIDQLRVEKVSDAAIKAAIWKLYAAGLLELTDDWNLRSAAL